MKPKSFFTKRVTFSLVAGLALALVAVLWMAGLAAAESTAGDAAGGAPTVVSYQGFVSVGGTPYTGSGYFKFAIGDAAGTTTYWCNDGTYTVGEPAVAVQLAVNNGLFSVLLGDTSIPNMLASLKASVFDGPDRYLRVWFSASGSGPFTRLTPDTRIAAVPYALQAETAVDADTVDGAHASDFADAAHNHKPSEISPQGADSGLDADTVDGSHAKDFAGAAHNHAPADISPQGAGSGLNADMVDGLHASDLETHYQNVVIVAQSGGDYTNVQAAIDSISDAAADNPYLVWVAPGVYSETVTMKPYVHLQGAGQGAAIITSTISTDATYSQATLKLASDASLRDLTVGNGGKNGYQIAILATTGTTRTLVSDVTARVQGSGGYNHVIALKDNTGVTLEQVAALGENGNSNYGLYTRGAAIILRNSSFTGRGGTFTVGIFNTGSLLTEGVAALSEGNAYSYGLENFSGAAILRGGSFTGRGGTNAAMGIHNASGLTLDAEGVTALGEGNSDKNYGLYNYNAAATLRGGSFTGSGGTFAHGIRSVFSGATLDAEGVTALAQGASDENFGLFNGDDSQATLRDGSFTGRGGIYARGIHNTGDGTTLDAEGVTALAEGGSTSNYGLRNEAGEASLQGGSFTGNGGSDAWGISNAGEDATLEANSLAAQGRNGSYSSYGLSNDGGLATLHGSSFIGYDGLYALGIFNEGTLEARGIAALGEDGFYSYGLGNSDTATLNGGSYIGRGGVYAYGIFNLGSLEARNITALGEGSSDDDYGLKNQGGTATADSSQFVGADDGLFLGLGAVYLGLSQLDGGATRTGGTLTCYLVYDGSYAAYTCP